MLPDCAIFGAGKEDVWGVVPCGLDAFRSTRMTIELADLAAGG